MSCERSTTDGRQNGMNFWLDGQEIDDAKVDEEAMGTIQKLKSGLVKRMSIVKMIGGGGRGKRSSSN